MINILEIKHLNVQFYTSTGVVNALQNIDVNVEKGKLTAIIGESGSGKSVLGSAIIGLLPQNAKAAGKIFFNGQDLLELGEKELEKLRGKDIAWVAQNPLAALNPAWNVTELVSEAAVYHKQLKAKDKRHFSENLLQKLNLEKSLSYKYSFELSGGMAQRVLIATGVGLKPQLLIMDEPTKGLDYKSVAAVEKMIFSLLEAGVTILLITHDLDFAERVADRVVVIYEAKIVENALASQFFLKPQAEYCQKLLKASPKNGLQAINQHELEEKFERIFSEVKD